MSRIRMLGLALPVLLLVAVLGLWLAPGLTDWTARRDQLAALAAERLGVPVSLSGPVHLTLLPAPMLEAEGVSVGGEDAALGFGARALRLRLDGWQLLLGRLAPRELVLVGAAVRLPWPPTYGLSLSAGLPLFRAEIEDSTLTLASPQLGPLVLEQVRARLATGTDTQALQITGSFVPAPPLPEAGQGGGGASGGSGTGSAAGTPDWARGWARNWAGREVRFDAALGHGSPDGAMPLSLTLSSGGTTVSTRGRLLGEGNVEGRAEASGPDLSLLLPGPQGPFRAQGHLSASAEGVTVDDLDLDLGGSPARGTLTLTLRPASRLVLSLVAGRIDLDRWIEGLHGDGQVPMELDLAAESAVFRGVPLRRLRAALLHEAGQLRIREASATLPGETTARFANVLVGPRPGAPAAPPLGSPTGTLQNSSLGFLAGRRLEGTLTFQGDDLRATLLALGWPLGDIASGRLRAGQGQLRLVAEDGQFSVPEFAATLDGATVSGAGVVRAGSRPFVGLGLTLDRLDLDGLLAPGRSWEEMARDLAGFDANLRLITGSATLRGVTAERLALDVALEAGRLTLRQFNARVLEADLSASGLMQVTARPRLGDLRLEVAAPDPRPLFRALPGGWPDTTRMAQQPLALRLSGSGPFDALALRVDGDWGDLRLESSGAVNLAARKLSANLTLRHPGAPRLGEELLGQDLLPALGAGSLSLVSTVSAGPQGISAERFDLVAGELRTSGQLSLAFGNSSEWSRLSGRLDAEDLPLPPFSLRSDTPLVLAPLRLLNADVSVTADRLRVPFGRTVLSDADGRLRLDGGVLRVDLGHGRLSSGTLWGSFAADASGELPRFQLQAALGGMTIEPPLAGWPYDLSAGRMDANLAVAAEGRSGAAVLATLEGQAGLVVSDGTLVGLDLPQARAAAEATGTDAPAQLRAALAGGSSGFERLQLNGVLEQGRLRLNEGLLQASGQDSRIDGEMDVPRGTVDLRLQLATPVEGAPPVTVGIAGPWSGVRLVPDLTAWLIWQAGR